MIGPRLRALSVLVIVFLAGGATGALLMRARAQRTAMGLIDGSPDRLIERAVLWRIDHAVKLTPEQEARIGEIVHRGRQRAALLRRRIYPELAADWRAQAERIREVLAPEQRPAFDRLAADWNARARSVAGLPPVEPGGSGGAPAPR